MKKKLNLTDNTPVFTKNYRITQTQKLYIKGKVQNMLEHIESSTSDYNSPILIVPKKSNSDQNEKRTRLVIDYRKINTKLIADKYPLPIVDEILHNLGKSKYFCCLDLTSGFQ